jgi:hypothetical protein
MTFGSTVLDVTLSSVDQTTEDFIMISIYMVYTIENQLVFVVPQIN